MSKWCIGIDLGGTFIKYTLLGEDFKARGTFQLPTPGDPDSLVRQMVSGAEQLMEREKVSRQDIVGVGIGSPGPSRISEGIIIRLPNIPGMENCPIRDQVGSALKLPAALENDANAAAYGEFIAGAGAGTKDMVLLTLGTGVGGGIVVDGKIVHGAHEVGAELGHVMVAPGGEQCNCGQKGCLERYCSATFMVGRAVRAIEQGEKSSLAAVIKQKGSINSKDVLSAAKAGDALASRMWDEMAFYLAVGCINFCRMLDPDKIVLAGGLAKAGDDLLSPVLKHFKAMDWQMTRQLTEIVLGKLGNDAGAIGSAGVAWAALGGK